MVMMILMVLMMLMMIDGGDDDDGGDEKDESCDLSLWQQVAPPASIALLSHPGQIMAAFAQSFD